MNYTICKSSYAYFLWDQIYPAKKKWAEKVTQGFSFSPDGLCHHYGIYFPLSAKEELP